MSDHSLTSSKSACDITLKHVIIAAFGLLYILGFK